MEVIIKFLKLGHEVHIVDLTNGEPTPHGTPEIRRGECNKATALLGVSGRDKSGSSKPLSF